MSIPMVSVENLSKVYRIGVAEPVPTKWYQAVFNTIQSPFSYLAQMMRKPTEEETLWAIKDVSFDVAEGEVMGLIGKNGAGKSTLLKILSRITGPTSGRIIMRGHVSSLLEVGTGFHPDLTGRENIYLSGTILGMKKSEIDRKLDEIVDFAEIERFLDTPIKRYSSGMNVRLGFAVAAHLEPEILIVDEVLSVGDLEFQKKCLGKMQNVSSQGRTVIFVSHNMTAVTSLCQRAVLLNHGTVEAIGTAPEIVAKYIQQGLKGVGEITWTDASAPGNETTVLRRVRLHTENCQTTDSFDIRKPVGVEIEYQVLRPGIWFTPSIQVKNGENVILFNSNQSASAEDIPRYHSTGLWRSTCWIPGNLLAEGTFMVRIVMFGFTHPPHKGIHVEDAVQFNVYDRLEGDSVRGKMTGFWPGVMRPDLKWTCTQVS